MKKFISVLIGICIGISWLLAFGLLVVEWASGCGETYTDSKGVVHQHACVFVVKSTKE